MTPDIRMTWAEGADRTLPLPTYETEGAAGADLRANLPDRQPLILASGARALVPTGLHVEIPMGFEMQVRPRSGLALKKGLGLPNTPGTIDSDYRGPLGVILINFGQEPVKIEHGDRIAQAVIAPVVQARFTLADTLTETARGSHGFGSTGQG
ncbi:MAG: dUTP diphosphatase [Pseudomonadota bacterium]